MRCAGLWLLLALCAASVGTEAWGQGYYQSYGSYSYYPPYRNNYHGYWRDLGYGFSNQPTYGGYQYSQGYWGAPAYGSGMYGPGYPSQYGGYPYGGRFNRR